MSRHLKSHAIFLLNSIVDHYVKLPPKSAPRARGVRYFRLISMYTQYSGKINTFKQGRKYHKHIISRVAPEHNGLLQLYTYHFPKTWSAACVANRELIKEAQRRAHALEHDYSPVALEWRLRFFKHYFRVIKGGFDPEPGSGRYTRFYQYVFVAIYRDLKAAQQPQTTSNDIKQSQTTVEDVTFSPIEQRPLSADIIRRPLRSTFGTIFAQRLKNNYAYEKVHLPRYAIVPHYERTSDHGYSNGHDPGFIARCQSESRLQNAQHLV